MDLRRPVHGRPLRFLSRPSGAVRARALAAGVPLPKAGSFTDAIMQEVLFRQRNLRHVEMVTLIGVLEHIGHILIDGAYGATPDQGAYEKLHAPLRGEVDRFLKQYEAEVFEDRYLPAYQQAQAEEDRKRKLEALEREQREAKAKKRVERFSEDEAPPKK